MPIISNSYNPPILFKNGHFSTIYSALFRNFPRVEQERERIILKDGDFLDIDWSFPAVSNNKVAILLHGLEGNAQRSYMQGMAYNLLQKNWDVASVNFRGCSGEVNRSYMSYNAGRTDDLEEIIERIVEKDRYTELIIIGFSLGGNLLLKYLGERDSVPKIVKKGIAISAPIYLKGSLEALSKPNNWIYQKSFLLHLRKKYKRKMSRFPDLMNKDDLNKIRSLLDFDNIYTAPAHGFKDAFDYYEKNSSLQFLKNIRVPVLLLNAKNDSFLSEECYPHIQAENSKNVFLETPEYGGHVGFYSRGRLYYNELRTLEFIAH
jgi:predicted alpha/beta-fold hydrolase